MTESEIILRLARVADLAAMTDMCLRSKASNGYDKAFMQACRDELTIREDDLALREYWLAMNGTTLCGCAGLAANQGRVGEIVTFFIDPCWQRRRVGSMLWEKLLARSKLIGLSALRLDADPFAVAFYRALGFQVVGEVPSGSIAGRKIPRMLQRLR